MSEGSSVASKSKVDSAAGELSDVDNENCSSCGNGSSGEAKRTCVDCGTLTTPLWRGGPAGPKSLCNACGIKSRKKRQAALGVIKPDEMKKKRHRKSNSCDSDLSFDHHPNNAKKNKKISKGDDDDDSRARSSEGVSKYLDLGFKVPVMKRSAVEKKRLWKKLGEDERAAVLLMALSCGSLYS